MEGGGENRDEKGKRKERKNQNFIPKHIIFLIALQVRGGSYKKKMENSLITTTVKKNWKTDNFMGCSILRRKYYTKFRKEIFCI